MQALYLEGRGGQIRSSKSYSAIRQIRIQAELHETLPQIKVPRQGTGDMAWWYRAHMTLVEDSSSVPRTHFRQLTTFFMEIQHLWPLRLPGHMSTYPQRCTGMHVHTHVHIKINE